MKFRVLGLFDFDPHGFNILSCFQHGSRNNANANVNHVTSEITWIGKGQTYLHHIPNHAIIDMIAGDIKACENLLQQIYIKQHPN